MSEDWYDKNIEAEIRPVVRLLRDNGVNTESSCGHEMSVQCQYRHEGFLWDVDRLLFEADYQDYSFSVTITREDGHLRHSMDIEFRQPSEQVSKLKTEIVNLRTANVIFLEARQNAENLLESERENSGIINRANKRLADALKDKDEEIAKLKAELDQPRKVEP